MIKTIETLNSVSTDVNSDGATLEMREIEITYENKKTDRGYTFVWVYENGKEFPPKALGQVVVSKKDMVSLISKAVEKDWF